MCTSPQAIFAWVGAVLVNFGFISLITWSSQKLWPLGFGLCAAYTVLLFRLAMWLHRREENEGSQVTEQQDGTVNEENQNDNSPQQDSVVGTRSGDPTVEGFISLPVSLLYGLAVVSMGVCGLFIPVNVFKECYPYGPYLPDFTWTTNISSLPDGVQQWAKKKVEDPSTWNTASFAYLVDTKTTFFSAQTMSGTVDTYGLWSVNNMSAPEYHQDYMYPGDFIAVSDQAVCFNSVSMSHKLNGINCADKTGIFPSLPLPEGDPLTNTFLAYNSTLWFKALPTLPNEGGSLVYSLDPATMNATLHSFKESTNKNDDNDCDNIKNLRKQAITTFFVTALPVTLASIALWRSEHIPSMAVTTYTGLIAMLVSIFVAARPQADIEKPLQWCCSVTAILWLLVLTYINLLPSTSQVRRAPLHWGFVIGGLAFLNTWVFRLLDKDRLIDWILFNVLLVVPLLLLGTADSNGFLQFLAACGFLADAGRLAGFAGDHVGGQADTPVQFLVFSVTGLLVGLGGFQVSQYQYSVKQFASTVVEKLNKAIMAPYVDPDILSTIETEQEPSGTVPLLNSPETENV